MKSPDLGPQKEVLVPGAVRRVVSNQAAISAPGPVVPAAPPAVAMKYHSEFAGLGCILQGFGIFVVLFGLALGPIGLVMVGGVGLFLLVAGSQQSVRLLCGHCGNRVDNKTVILCPSCQGRLFYEAKSLKGFVIFMVVAVVIIKGAGPLTEWLAGW